MTDRPITLTQGEVVRLGNHGAYQLRRFLGRNDGCPWYPGDLLWVRETFFQPMYRMTDITDEVYGSWGGMFSDIRYAADGAKEELVNPGAYASPTRKKRPSVHMQKWASRYTLEVVKTYVQKIQDITREEALAEGFCGQECLRYHEEGEMCSDTPERDGCDNTGWLDDPLDHFKRHWSNTHKEPGTRWEDNPAVRVLVFQRVVSENNLSEMSRKISDALPWVGVTTDKTIVAGTTEEFTATFVGGETEVLVKWHAHGLTVSIGGKNRMYSYDVDKVGDFVKTYLRDHHAY